MSIVFPESVRAESFGHSKFENRPQTGLKGAGIDVIVPCFQLVTAYCKVRNPGRLTCVAIADGILAQAQKVDRSKLTHTLKGESAEYKVRQLSLASSQA